jgi:hypothetical protein
VEGGRLGPRILAGSVVSFTAATARIMQPIEIHNSIQQ